jgi:omega-amidase
MQDIKVALVQTRQFWEDKNANFQHFEKHFQNHIVGNEIDLVILPEMFNTAFTMNTEAMAEKMDGPSIQWLTHWAEKLNCQMAASLIIEDNGKYHNRFVVVTSKGVESFYDKRHLFRMAEENKHFTAGEERVIHELKGWKILLQVCYDLRFPVFSRNKTIGDEKEYDAMIYIANWPEKRNYAWKTLLKARAMENQVYAIGVNRVGVDGKDISYSGDSMLVDPWGLVDFQFAESQETVKILTLKTAVLNEIIERFPAFKDAD